MRKNEHDEHCKSIAERLDSIVNGELYRDADGNEWEWYDEDDDGTQIVCTYEYTIENGAAVKHVVSAYSDDGGETWTRGDDGEPVELEQIDMVDGIGDVYNVEYRTSGRDEEPSSVQLMITCGGPNIYIDTKSGDVELYWWGETGRYPLSVDVIDAVNELYLEFWNC